MVSSLSLLRFIFVFLMAIGTVMFSVVSAQINMATEEVSVIENPSLGILTVFLKNQDDRLTYGEVWLESSDGKELQVKELKDGVYYMEIPVCYRGKELVVSAKHLGQKKHAKVSMFQVSEELELTIVFRSNRRRKYYTRYKY